MNRRHRCSHAEVSSNVVDASGAESVSMAGNESVAEDGAESLADAGDPDAIALIEMLEMFPSLIGAPPAISDGSRMAADQTATASLQITMATACGHYLAASAECLVAVHELMVSEDGEVVLLRFALYPLLRSVIEACAQTVWILGPDHQRERIVRLLQVLKGDLDYDGKTGDVQSRPRDDDSPAMRSQVQAIRRHTAPRRTLRWGWITQAGTNPEDRAS